MTEQEKELMKHFKVEELEERLEMKNHWSATGGVEGGGTCNGGGCDVDFEVEAGVTWRPFN